MLEGGSELNLARDGEGQESTDLGNQIEIKAVENDLRGLARRKWDELSEVAEKRRLSQGLGLVLIAGGYLAVLNEMFSVGDVHNIFDPVIQIHHGILKDLWPGISSISLGMILANNLIKRLEQHTIIQNKKNDIMSVVGDLHEIPEEINKRKQELVGKLGEMRKKLGI